ncbi:MAG: sodium:proton antiporter [Acidobacteriota bacterium]
MSVPGAATHDPALGFAVALAAGAVAQVIARHLRIPGIVLLLGAGVLFGPDGLDLVRPEELGQGLHAIVGFAVAVILFEGGLNLNWKRLRREGTVIRRLVLWGALLTTAGGALLARTILGWSWTHALLFGTLVIVTGPTVITPLLRRTKVRHSVETILEAEGVLIDAVGAIIAIVALETLSSPDTMAVALGAAHVPMRLLAGAVIGVAGGVVIALALRFRHVIPDGLENVVVLALAVALYQVANALVPEAGIPAVIVAGLIVGNSRNSVGRELREFKEQLTVLLIGLLFMLLTANVRLAEIRELGLPGLAVVAGLVLLVRPLTVALCTAGSELSWRERAFIAWVGPRGIVAAAVATLFAERLDAAGDPAGHALRALVFLVIAITVVVQGPLVGPAARLLGVRRPRNHGYAILGATPLALELAQALRDGGEPVVLLDANADHCREAEERGFDVIFGNALEETRLARAEIDTRRAAIGALPNAALNLLFVERARREFGVPAGMIAIPRGTGAVQQDAAREAGWSVLFGAPAELELWSVRLHRGLAHVEEWTVGEARPGEELASSEEMATTLLPLVSRRGERVRPFDDRVTLRPGDRVAWLVFDERAGSARAWLAGRGFTR